MAASAKSRRRSSSNSASSVDTRSFAREAMAHFSAQLALNEAVMERVTARLVKDVRAGRSLLVFGSGHSALFPLELYHRAGGASFVIPLVSDCLLPSSGPPLVRRLERTAGIASPILSRALPRRGEMLWLASQSGINSAVVDLALEARNRGLFTVAFTSLSHSKAVPSRHPSGKRLFEVCHEVVDLGGRPGDALIPLGPPGKDQLRAGPFSTLSSIMLSHSIMVAACAKLEKAGIRCVYTSVNTPEGEARNRAIEKKAAIRDPLLRE